MAIEFIKTIVNVRWLTSNVFHIVLSVAKATITPVVGIIVLSAIIYFMNKQAKKSLVTTITAVTVARVPEIIATVISVLRIISSNARIITVPFASLCTVISTILTYFTMKALFEEKENSKFLTTFVIVETIYFASYIVIGLLGIYI